MTNPEAQLFVKRWGRVLFFGFDLPDTFAARAMEHSFLGLAICPLPAIFLATVLGSLPPLSHWPLSIIIAASAIMVLSYWLGLRFRVARRLLDAADERHLVELRRHL
jgi:hypothetical protein